MSTNAEQSVSAKNSREKEACSPNGQYMGANVFLYELVKSFLNSSLTSVKTTKMN